MALKEGLVALKEGAWCMGFGGFGREGLVALKEGAWCMGFGGFGRERLVVLKDAWGLVVLKESGAWPAWSLVFLPQIDDREW